MGTPVFLSGQVAVYTVGRCREAFNMFILGPGQGDPGDRLLGVHKFGYNIIPCPSGLP